MQTFSEWLKTREPESTNEIFGLNRQSIRRFGRNAIAAGAMAMGGLGGGDAQAAPPEMPAKTAPVAGDQKVIDNGDHLLITVTVASSKLDPEIGPDRAEEAAKKVAIKTLKTSTIKGMTVVKAGEDKGLYTATFKLPKSGSSPKIGSAPAKPSTPELPDKKIIIDD